MRRAMAEAEVGDDAYGEDPTVRRLEEAYAERVGKEAGLFVPSGTMANQVALRALAAAGTAVVAGRSSHVARLEDGATGVLQSAQLHTVDDAGGCPDHDEVADVVEGVAHHGVAASVVCVEDTHMWAGGVPLDRVRLRSLAGLGVPVHVDGARLFNAEVATGVPAATRVAAATTVWTALTKGLGAPVGSVLAGPVAVVAEARRWRRRLGGQLRQAGVLAAAGLVALDGVASLAEDHARAARLAEAVAERWPGALDPATVRTNLVVFPHPDPAAVLDHLAGEGVLAGTIAPRTLRLVTSLEVDDDDVDRACRALATAP
jgi:threonine aldolase